MGMSSESGRDDGGVATAPKSPSGGRRPSTVHGMMVRMTPSTLARAYLRFVQRPEAFGLSSASVDWTLAAMRRLPLVAGQSRAGDVAWKSGTSSGRRDAWCVGITEAAVVVVWLGNHDGRGLPDLVGVRSANRLLAEVVAVLGGDV